jgi:hypothetical protein
MTARLPVSSYKDHSTGTNDNEVDLQVPFGNMRQPTKSALVTMGSSSSLLATPGTPAAVWTAMLHDPASARASNSRHNIGMGLGDIIFDVAGRVSVTLTWVGFPAIIIAGRGPIEPVTTVK